MANDAISIEAPDPFEVDPEVIERGTRGHALTQNALASFLLGRGVAPLSPAVGEPEFDLAWRDGAALFVTEVKSITDGNEEKQLRLGLGQLLRYRYLLLSQHDEVVAVLTLEREPKDASWKSLCAGLGVLVVWPGRFESLLERR